VDRVRLQADRAGGERSITIGITGKYAALRDAYASIDKALEHCSAHLGSARSSRSWIDTTEITTSNVAQANSRG
jgi:CTP synthase